MPAYFLEHHQLFHLLTGNLSHQIEHHLFPDMPARHYARIAPKIQAICQKYELPYNTGRFGRQLRQVMGRIHYFSKPRTAEWQAYLQSQSPASTHAVKEETKDVPVIRGLGEIPSPSHAPSFILCLTH